MPRLKSARNTKIKKKCVKSTAYPCGFTCIARYMPDGKERICRNVLRRQADTFSKWLKITEERLAKVNAYRSSKGKDTLALKNDVALVKVKSPQRQETSDSFESAIAKAEKGNRESNRKVKESLEGWEKYKADTVAETQAEADGKLSHLSDYRKGRSITQGIEGSNIEEIRKRIAKNDFTFSDNAEANKEIEKALKGNKTAISRFIKRVKETDLDTATDELLLDLVDKQIASLKEEGRQVKEIGQELTGLVRRSQLLGEESRAKSDGKLSRLSDYRKGRSITQGIEATPGDVIPFGKKTEGDRPVKPSAKNSDRGSSLMPKPRIKPVVIEFVDTINLRPDKQSGDPMIVDALARTQDKVGGYIRPMILSSKKPSWASDSFTIIEGNEQALAAQKALKQNDSLEMTQAIIISEHPKPIQDGIREQLNLLRGLQREIPSIDQDVPHLLDRKKARTDQLSQLLPSLYIDVVSTKVKGVENVDKKLVTDLANSFIKSDGNINPIVVKRTGAGTFEVVSGKIEFLAMQKALSINDSIEQFKAIIIDSENAQGIIEQTKLFNSIEKNSVKKTASPTPSPKPSVKSKSSPSAKSKPTGQSNPKSQLEALKAEENRLGKQLDALLNKYTGRRTPAQQSEIDALQSEWRKANRAVRNFNQGKPI